jgi:hypothetical protein
MSTDRMPQKALGSRRYLSSGELTVVVTLAAAARGACAPCAHWTPPASMGWLKGRSVGQSAGPQPMKPLWPWAAAEPKGIVQFSNFI